jgi:hypothetical protein
MHLAMPAGNGGHIEWDGERERAYGDVAEFVVEGAPAGEPARV